MRSPLLLFEPISPAVPGALPTGGALECIKSLTPQSSELSS